MSMEVLENDPDGKEIPAQKILAQKGPGDALIFACRMCGECCTSWNIPIEAEKAKVLLTREWVQARLRKAKRTIQEVTAQVYRVPLNRENYCVFLDEDKRCLIEVHEGQALKPQHCKNFPFAGVRMPDGAVHYDTSTVCTVVSEEYLGTFRPIFPSSEAPEIELEEMAATVKRTRFSRVPLAVYFEYLDAVQEIFENPKVTPTMALKGAQRVLKGLPQGPKADGVHAFEFSALLKFWVPVVFLRKPYGTVSWLALMGEGVYGDPKLFESAVALRGQGRIRWPGGELDVLMKAFLLQLLQRKVLLSFGHSLQSVLVMAVVSCFVVEWYARTFAMMLGRAQVERGDVTLAIRMTERYYTGHQPRFPEFFRNCPIIGMLEALLLGQ